MKRLPLGAALVVASLGLGGCVERDVYACKAEAEKAYADPYCAGTRASTITNGSTTCAKAL